MALKQPTEAEWLSAGDPRMMLDSLGKSASIRKLQLLVVAVTRRLWSRFTDWEKETLDTMERIADGTASRADIDRCRRKLPLGEPVSEYWGVFGRVVQAMMDVQFARTESATEALSAVLDFVAEAPGHRSTSGFPDRARETRARAAHIRAAALVREVFGSSNEHVVIDPAWLRWNDGTVPALAQAIYDDRRFDHLPILGDALEEAGCCSEQVLLHCRAPGEHCRGCWLIDLLLEHT